MTYNIDLEGYLNFSRCRPGRGARRPNKKCIKMPKMCVLSLNPLGYNFFFIKNDYKGPTTRNKTNLNHPAVKYEKLEWKDGKNWIAYGLKQNTTGN